MPFQDKLAIAAFLLCTLSGVQAHESATAPLLNPVDLSGNFVPVPFKICRRLPNVRKLDGWRTVDGADWVDAGTCAGGCIASSLSGKKECSPTATGTVTIVSTQQPPRTRQIEIIKECGCVCCDHHICPDGFFWNAENCRCIPRVEPRPCQRFSEYTNIFNSMVDVGVCRGECDNVDEACRGLVFGTQLVAYNGMMSQVQTVGKCGCSNCAVKPQWIVVEKEDGTLLKVNIGMCAGVCGPEMWPTDTSDLSQYWTSACVRAETAPLQVSDTIVLEQVTKCDCKPVKPKCQRIPKYITFWSAVGEQRLDVGACVGRCGLTSEKCIPTLMEQVLCDGLDPADASDPTMLAACQKFQVIVECGCQPPVTAGTATPAP